MFFKNKYFFNKRRYNTQEEFNLALNTALKSGTADQDKAFGYLSSEIESTIATYCYQHHLNEKDVKRVLQETLIKMYVKINKKEYPPKGNMAYSPIAFAKKIGHYKTLEAAFRREKVSFTVIPIEELSIANELEFEEADKELQLTQWKDINKMVNHLKENMKGICADLIWKIKAEKRSYDEIHPDYPQYKEQGGLRNQVSKCWNKWRELLENDGLIKKRKQ